MTHTFRLITRQQADGTWYGALHATGVCRGAYGFASRELAWSWAWDQQIAFVRALHAAEAIEVDDTLTDEENLALAKRSMQRSPQ